MNDTLWVFGDSFCAGNDNYIRTIYKRGKYKSIKVLGLSSSSTYYSLLKLSENVHLFKPNDSIMFGVTNGNRHFFADNHFSGGSGITKGYDEKNQKYIPTPKHLQDIYNDFFTYLWDFKQGNIINETINFYIQKGIMKHVDVKNFILFNTIESKDFISNKFGMKTSSPYMGMLECILKFHHEHLGQKDKRTTEILKENNLTNHWINHPDYEDYFWNIYNKLFEPLWLN